MKNFVIGVVVGSLVTFLITRLATPDAATPTQTPAAAQASTSSSEAHFAQSVAPPARVATPAAPSTPQRSEQPAARLEGAPPQSAATNGAAVAPTASAPPSNLSAAHAQLLERPDPGHSGPSALASLHQNFTNQSRDESWAAAAEQNLKQYLSQAAQPPEFNVAAIDCRNDLCEIQAYGYTEAAAGKWNVLVAGMSQQPWWYLFSGNTGSSTSNNGQAVILTILHRGST